MSRKILVIDLVGLTSDVLARMPLLASCFSGESRRTLLVPPLPAVTCTSQATITTGALPRDHGVVSNGWYFRESAEVRFWMRSDHLVGGEKIWEAAQKAQPEVRVANLFWRYGAHSSCSIQVTERPTYWSNGRKGPDVYTSPGALRDELVERLGEFPLFRFWGPATSIESSNWIAEATRHVMRNHDPHLTLTYLPHLDYDLQKFGPDSEPALRSIGEVDRTVAGLIEAARALDREIAVLSEYGMTAVSHPVYLNRELRRAGYVAVQKAQNGELLEAGALRAFAACSHQVAHVYVANHGEIAAVKKLLAAIPGVGRVLDQEGKVAAGLDHPRSGELVAVAAPGAWFAYPHWLDDADAPDFARCVAIHDKPGHDPGEMFLGPGGKAKVIRRLLQMKLGFRVPMDVISLDATRIRGSHGRPPEREEDHPLLLTSWAHHAQERLPMQEVKSLLLERLLGVKAGSSIA